MSDRVNPTLLRFHPIAEQDHTNCQGFFSGNQSMDNFLKQEAYYRHILREGSTTLIMLDNECVGYFTLRRKDIELHDGTIEARNGLDIARLAISGSMQNKGIGESSIRLIKEIAYMINERYITLDALFEKREWYRKLGFKPAIEQEYEAESEDSLVYMYLDTYDTKLLEDYFDNP